MTGQRRAHDDGSGAWPRSLAGHGSAVRSTPGMRRAAVACFAALLALLQAAAPRHAASNATTGGLTAESGVRARVQAFCSSAALNTSASCGWASASEEQISGQCLSCGTVWRGSTYLDALPKSVEGNPNYYQFAFKVPSLTCKGPAVVRAVFKQLIPLQTLNQRYGGTGCADLRLLPNGGDPAAAPPVVRCELQLPAGAGSETERALRSKETNCYLCTSCAAGGGCPNSPGKWYSDSYVVSLQGCGSPDRKLDLTAAPWERRATLVVNSGSNALLAKFEICQSKPWGCYDAAYEAAKLKGAKRCTKGRC